MKKLLLFLILLSFYSCSAYKYDQNQQSTKKVIIIGAGISGLSAAKELKDNGVDVVILEAQNKLGGRISTNRSLGFSFDEGASWIHGPKGNPINELATISKAKTYLTEDDNTIVYDKLGDKHNEDSLSKNEKEFNSIIRKLHRKGAINKSFSEVFYANYPQYKNNNLWTYMLSAYLEFDTGADINKLSSINYYDDNSFSGEDLIITNGYDKLTNYLAKDLNIELNTKVTGIDYSQKKITIETSKGSFTADKVLVTVPLGVLKKNVIKFNPKLPKATQNAIDNLKMGSVNKFLLQWEKPFWDNNAQYIGYTPKEKGKFNYFLNLNTFTNSNALITFAFGDYSKLTETMSDAEIISEIMIHLKSIYGKDIPEPKSMLRTKWSSNTYSYGSYSFATNGTLSDDFEIFEEPINNKIFFAGEHTILDYRGTVHGAYLSGIREAKKIIKSE